MSNGKKVVWYDVSNLSTGVVFEIDGNVVKDSSRLRKMSDFPHIDVAELETIIKGINLALEWNLNDTELKTDSLTDAKWINSKITRSSGENKKES